MLYMLMPVAVSARKADIHLRYLLSVAACSNEICVPELHDQGLAQQTCVDSDAYPGQDESKLSDAN